MAAGAEDPSDARGAAAKPAEGGLQQLDRNLLLLKFSRQAAIARRGLPRSASAEDLAIPGVSGLIHGLCELRPRATLLQPVVPGDRPPATDPGAVNPLTGD